MKHRNSHFAVGYWSRIRAGQSVPDQADIDPKALKRLLPYVFLLDSRPDGSFSYRLAGTALCERFGMELRDKNFLAHWDRDSRTLIATLLRQSLRTGTPLCLTSIGATEECRMIEIETVLMPIAFGGNEPERFLAVAHTMGDLYALGGRAIQFERLVASSFVNEGEAFEVPPPADGGRAVVGPAKAPHLHLVSSRDTPPPPRRTPMTEAMKSLFAQFGANPEQKRD